MSLVDTHCHIHSIGEDSDDFTVRKWREGGIDDADDVIESAEKAGVSRLICVGTDLDDSKRAVDFAANHANCWASVGIHPHEAKKYASFPDQLRQIRNWARKDKVVAIGEVGLDYFKNFSPPKDQIKLLEFFLDVASSTDLPVIFHVRDAHKDFWPIYDNFKNIRGVMHSFSATTKELDDALERNLYIGLNGIMTFTRDKSQLDAAKAVPIEKLLLETDAPYLTPSPHRGKICEPKHVSDIASFLADLRGMNLSELSSETTRNASELFNIA